MILPTTLYFRDFLHKLIQAFLKVTTVGKETYKKGQNLFHFKSILIILKHFKNRKEIKMFTSSGNSSLTKDIISDVFPTLAVKKKNHYFNEVFIFYIKTQTRQSHRKVCYLLAKLGGIQITKF